MKKLLVMLVGLCAITSFAYAGETKAITKEDSAAVKQVKVPAATAVVSERGAKIDKMVETALKSKAVTKAVERVTSRPEAREFIVYNLKSAQAKRILKGTAVSKQLYDDKGELKLEKEKDGYSKGWVVSTIVLAVLFVVALAILVKVLLVLIMCASTFGLI